MLLRKNDVFGKFLTSNFSHWRFVKKALLCRREKAGYSIPSAIDMR
ncbi:hypothetical protein LEP1GSC171_3983 [Leptospira santarosai str. HAI1380]|nr:hypothetical protein LEP1GSC171_3983 [Leptospira santarosai str. HAI1380]